jgi:hypothetical protein
VGGWVGRLTRAVTVHCAGGKQTTGRHPLAHPQHLAIFARRTLATHLAHWSPRTMMGTPSAAHVGGRSLCARTLSGAAASSSLRPLRPSPGAMRPLRPSPGRTTRARARCGATGADEDPVWEGVDMLDGMAVLATHTHALDERPTHISKVVLVAFPQKCTSVSGARKLLRRGQVALDGRVVDAKRTVLPGETVQLLTRLRGLPTRGSDPNFQPLQVTVCPAAQSPACCCCASGRGRRW